jgi:Caspase domain
MTARALVVAVPNPCGGLAPLPGTSGDAVKMGNLLAGRGFAEVCIHSDGMTADAFATELLRLRGVTVPNDLAVVYFAGHGYRIPDVSGDEGRDGQDECLVCSDKLLANDWFGNEFWPQTAPGSWWVTCADTCFGATVFVKESSLVEGVVADFVVTEDYISDDEIVPLPVVAAPLEALPTPGTPARIWLAAAGERENALEIDAADGDRYGWYSRQLVDLLTQDGNLTYRGLWYRLQKRWLADKASRYATLASPCMALTEAAEPLADLPAFKAV